MKATQPAAVVGIGACTPLGLNARSTFAAFRAGLLNASETATMDSRGEPIRGSRLDVLAGDAVRQNRMLDLADLALRDLAAAGLPPANRRVSAFIGLAASPAVSDLAEPAIDRMLQERIAAIRSKAQFFRRGRSSVFFALEAALAALSSDHCDAALVGGIDSLCAPESLRELDAQRRLLGAMPDGVIPGEGAAFVLLARSQAAVAAAARPDTFVLCAATRHEARHHGQKEPNTGQGLTSTLRALRDHPAGSGLRADILYTCETGERFWAEEFMSAYLRNTPMMPEPFKRTMAAESFGDLGAAAGAVMLALGVLATRKLRSTTASDTPPVFLLCGSSDAGEVGACFVQASPPDTKPKSDKPKVKERG